MKTCTKCGETKPKTEFGKHTSGRDGLRPTCKSCHNAAGVQWAKDNRERRRETAAKWRADNRDKCRAYAAKYFSANIEKERERYAVSTTPKTATHAAQLQRIGELITLTKRAKQQKSGARPIQTTTQNGARRILKKLLRQSKNGKPKILKQTAFTVKTDAHVKPIAEIYPKTSL